MNKLDQLIASHALIKKMCNVEKVYIKISDELWVDSDAYIEIKNKFPDECIVIEKQIKDE